MNENKYIDQVIVLFKEHGLSMSMEEIAQNIGVTKKTLYNRFVNKDKLLEKCINKVNLDLQQRLNDVNDRTKDVCECFILFISEMRTFFREMSPVFLNDLLKLYPTQANNDHILGSRFFVQLLENNIERGKAENIYRAEIDAKLMAGYISFSIFAFFRRSVMLGNEYSAEYYFDKIIDFNLKALLKSKL